MSETPRTDYELGVMGGAAIKAVNRVDANFARGLERELAEAKKAIAEFVQESSWAADVWKRQPHIAKLFKLHNTPQGGEVGP